MGPGTNSLELQPNVSLPLQQAGPPCLRVLIFAPNYYPATRYGGPVRSSHGLAKTLIDMGHEVEVVTTDIDGPGTLDVHLGKPQDYDGVPVTYFPVTFPRRIYRSPSMQEFATAHIATYDIVHINGIYLWPGQMLARLAKARAVPFLLSPRGMLAPEMIAGKSALAKKAWISTAENITLRHAAAIHVTSESEAEGIGRLGFAPERVHVIPNGVAGPYRPPSSDAINAIWSDIPEGCRVAFLGRIDWTKGIDLAIEAVRIQDAATLLIAGPDQIGLRPKLETRLIRDDGSRAGHFIGELGEVEKWAFLAGADLLIAPSLRESFGLSVAEALSVGTPVICTEGVGARTIVEKIDPLSVVEREVAALAKALTRLLADSSARVQYGRRASKLMAQEYGWPTIARKMIGLYDSAARPW